jgi:hypothetical protein
MEAMARVMLEDTEMSRQWKRFGVTRNRSTRQVTIPLVMTCSLPVYTLLTMYGMLSVM